MGIKLTAADVQGADENELYAALALIKDEVRRRAEGPEFTEGVREDLTALYGAEIAAQVATVTFLVDHWDNGWFYTASSPTIALADGSTPPDEADWYDTGTADALTELSNVRREDLDEGGLDRYSRLVVDLTTGKIEHDTAY